MGNNRQTMTGFFSSFFFCNGTVRIRWASSSIACPHHVCRNVCSERQLRGRKRAPCWHTYSDELVAALSVQPVEREKKKCPFFFFLLNSKVVLFISSSWYPLPEYPCVIRWRGYTFLWTVWSYRVSCSAFVSRYWMWLGNSMTKKYHWDWGFRQGRTLWSLFWIESSQLISCQAGVFVWTLRMA